MSVPAPLVVPIFATPFGVLTLPRADETNGALLALLRSRATAKWHDPGAAPGALVFRSREDLCEWPDEPARLVTQSMLAAVSAVAASVNQFTPERFAALRVQARAWFTIVHPDGCVPSANYPNGSWLAVYCVAAPAPSATRFDSGVLRLHESRYGTMFPDATNSDTVMPYRPGHSTWRPVPGQVAVFPACVTHEVALVRSVGELVLVTARVRYVGSEQTGVPWW